MVDLTKVHTKESAVKTLESVCPKFIYEHFPNLDTDDFGRTTVIAHALKALGKPYVEHHMFGDFEFIYDNEEGLKVSYDEPKNKVDPKYLTEQKRSQFERRLADRRRRRQNPPKKLVKKLERNLNGMGSGFAQIAVIVEKPYHEIVEGHEQEFEVLAENENSMTFLYVVKNNYAGDDETIVHSLWGDFPKAVIDGDQFKIDWSNSGY